jgi:hypothetical protein
MNSLTSEQKCKLIERVFGAKSVAPTVYDSYTENRDLTYTKIGDTVFFSPPALSKNGKYMRRFEHWTPMLNNEQFVALCEAFTKQQPGVTISLEFREEKSGMYVSSIGPRAYGWVGRTMQEAMVGALLSWASAPR